MPAHPTLQDVYAARQRISGLVRRTPLRTSRSLTEAAGAPVSLKLENTQETGSFKLRGAASKILSLGAEERRRGVVAVSSGNHGRAVAYVAAQVGTRAVVCISTRVPEVKAEAIRSLGAEVRVSGPTQDDADGAARALADEGLTFVHPFDDPLVVAGQGTVGLEILEDHPAVATVVVPLSGGGLISGVAVAMKSANPSVRVIGVSQDRGPAMYLSLRAGHLVDVVEEDTLADALAGGLGPVNDHSFAMCRDLVDETVLVTEEEIGSAMAALFREDGLVVEGGGAVGAAALRTGRVEAGGETVVVISGGNVDPATLLEVVSGRSEGTT